MTQHTPGPWAVVPARTGENDSIYFEVHDGFGRTATVYGDIATDGEEAANARLIAAAPELLEALRELADHCRAFYMAERESILLNARAAIAKATGGTP